jgi:hypothetical protein
MLPYRGEALAKDRTPAATSRNGTARSGSTSTGRGASTARGTAGGKGRTRPPTQVVTQPRRPWGLIAAAVAVLLFAVAAISYAVVKVNAANAGKIQSPDELKGLQTYDYAAGQSHVTTPVQYDQSPPVGGDHDPTWADCTGTVYDVDIRHENAVHSLEHGAVWITYNPDEVSDADIQKLSALAEESGRMMSPYAGLDSPISVQSWNHQLKVDSASDERLKQYVDFFTRNGDYYPEVGASCENPDFAQNPLVVGDESASGGASMPTDAPTTESGSAPSSSSSEAPAS